jgi:hypothetical protein
MLNVTSRLCTRDVQNGEMNKTNEHFRSKIHEHLLFVVVFHVKLHETYFFE